MKRRPHDALFKTAFERPEMADVATWAEKLNEPAVMTVAEQLINKGRAEGRVGLLTKQLALKFGELTEAWRVRLATANVDELDLWAERVLTAPAIDQVFAD